MELSALHKLRKNMSVRHISERAGVSRQRVYDWLEATEHVSVEAPTYERLFPLIKAYITKDNSPKKEHTEILDMLDDHGIETMQEFISLSWPCRKKVKRFIETLKVQ